MKSLKDILLKPFKRSKDAPHTEQVESYKMYSRMTENEAEGQNERTIIVKRLDLMFNDKDCSIVNLTDISTFMRLKQE